MKISKIIALFPLLFTAISYGAEQTQSPNGLVSYQANKNDQFEKILEKVPEAKKQYEECMNAGVPLENLEICLMEGKSDSSPSPTLVGTGLQGTAAIDEIKKIMSDTKDIYSNPNNDKKSYDSFDTLTSNINVSDPAYVALHEYMSKQLEEALYGDYVKVAGKDAGPRQRMVDHATFNDLFKNQVSNNILMAVSSYCLKANPTNHYFLGNSSGPVADPLPPLTSGSSEEEIIAHNTKNMSNVSASGEIPEAAKHFNKCMLAIPNICYKEGDYATMTIPSQAQQPACLVTNYLRKARQQLIAIENIDEQFKELGKNSGPVLKGQIAKAGQKATEKAFDYYSGEKSKGQKSVQEISVLTSNEAIEKSGFKKANEAVVTDLEQKCYDGTSILDAEACKQFIATDREDQNKLLAENILRQNAMKERIAAETGDKEGLVNYLVDEGYDESKARELVDTNETKIRDGIRDRFKAEKDALIKEMAGKISGNTSKAAEIDAADGSTINTIKDSIAKRPENLKQLLHFNNVVTSYLEVGSGNTTSMNVVSFQREMSNFEGEDSYIEGIKKAQEESGASGRSPSNDKGGSTTTVTSETITEKILKYFLN